MEDSFPGLGVGLDWAGGMFQDDLSALHLLCTLIQCRH